MLNRAELEPRHPAIEHVGRGYGRRQLSSKVVVNGLQPFRYNRTTSRSACYNDGRFRMAAAFPGKAERCDLTSRE